MFQSNKQAAYRAATRMKQALRRLETTRNALIDTRTTIKGNRSLHSLAEKEILGTTHFQQAMAADIANIQKVASSFEAMDLGIGKTYNKKS